MQKIGSIQEAADVRSYLLKAAKHQAIDHLRKQQRQRTVMNAEREDALKSIVELPDNQLVDMISNGMAYDRILQVIASLDDIYRDTLYPHFVLELSIPETASLLNCKTATAKQRLVRGKKLLQSDGDITYTFSPRFTRRMNRLAKAEKSWLWRMTSTASKRAAAAGIAMILIALTACSIPAIREPVAAFFKGTYENCVRFFTGNAGADRIAERYTLTELPDGFEAVYTVDNDASFTVVYRNEDGEEIILSQSVGADYWIDIDTQHGTLTEIDLSGVTVTLYEADGCMVALWQQDGYAFDLTIYGGLDREQVLRLVNSVRHP